MAGKQAPTKPAAKAAAPATSKSTAVTTKGQNTALTKSKVASSLLLEDSQQSQKFNVDDIALPRLVVLQSNSPQVTKGHALYQKGLTAGMIFNTATLKGYPAEKEEDQSILFVPAFFTPSYLEWGLRENNGGLKKDHGPDGSLMSQTTPDEKRRNILPNGNQLDRNALYYGLLVTDVDNGEFEQVALSLRSTQLKKARRWNSLIMGLTAEVEGQTIKAPMFYMAYKITTVPERNDQGNWFGVEITYGEKVLEMENGENIYLAARAFAKAAAGGTVKVKHDDPEEVIATAEIEPASGREPGEEDDDDDTPF